MRVQVQDNSVDDSEKVSYAQAKTRADAAPINPKKGAVVSPSALLAACSRLRAAPSMAIAEAGDCWTMNRAELNVSAQRRVPVRDREL